MSLHEHFDTEVPIENSDSEMNLNDPKISIIYSNFPNGYYLPNRTKKLFPLSDLNIPEISSEPYFLYFEDRSVLFFFQILFFLGPWIIIYVFFHFNVWLFIGKIIAVASYFVPSLCFFIIAAPEKDIVKSLKNKIKKLPVIKGEGNIKFVPLSWRDISGNFNINDIKEKKKFIRIIFPYSQIIVDGEDTKEELCVGKNKTFFSFQLGLNKNDFIYLNEDGSIMEFGGILFIIACILNLHELYLYYIGINTVTVPYIIRKVISVNQDLTSEYFNEKLKDLNPSFLDKKFSLEEFSHLSKEEEIEKYRNQLEKYLEKKENEKLKKQKQIEEKKKKREETLKKLKELGLKEGEFTVLCKKFQTSKLIIKRKDLNVKVKLEFRHFNGHMSWVTYNYRIKENNTGKSKIDVNDIFGGYEAESRYVPGTIKVIANGRSIEYECPNEYGFPKNYHFDYYEE